MRDGRIEKGEGSIKLILPSEVDHHILSMMRHSLDKLLFEEKPRELFIDFSAVEMMDSSAIGLVLGRLEICERLGARLKLVGVNGRARRLLELGGIIHFKNITIL